MKRKYKDKAERDHTTKRRWLHGSDEVIKQIYERDHSRCTACGVSEAEHKKTTTQHRSLVIHHVNLNNKDNRAENQILICTKCHNKLHGTLRKTKFDTGLKIKLHHEMSIRCAHNLRDEYPHNCKNVHGEYYRIRLWIEGQVLDEFGMLIDFKELKKMIKNKYDHKHLNTIKPFDKINPTVENFAKHLFIEMNLALSKVVTNPTLVKIRIYESDASYAEVTSNESK